jgi:hypothetical protein
MYQDNPNYAATIRTVIAAIASELRKQERAKQPPAVIRGRVANQQPEPCCAPACCFA